jgi:hypothetical protein
MNLLRFVIGLTVVAFAALPALGESYAVIVGVNQCPAFRLPDGARPRPLRGAEADADAVADMLIRNYGFPAANVQLLKGPEATSVKIKRALDTVARETRPADVFVFHFSGHGTRIPDRRIPAGRGALSEAICPYDTTERGENLIVDHDLGAWLTKIHAGQVTVLLDCCHAETEMKESADDDLAVRYLPMPAGAKLPAKDREAWPELRTSTKGVDRSQTLFFACRTDQQAYERRIPGTQSRQRRGQFTYYFLAALQQQMSDQNRDIGNEAVIESVKRRLEETFNSARPIPAKRQEPVMTSDEPDGPVFGLRTARPAERNNSQ